MKLLGYKFINEKAGTTHFEYVLEVKYWALFLFPVRTFFYVTFGKYIESPRGNHVNSPFLIAKIGRLYQEILLDRHKDKEIP